MSCRICIRSKPNPFISSAKLPRRSDALCCSSRTAKTCSSCCIWPRRHVGPPHPFPGCLWTPDTILHEVIDFPDDSIAIGVPLLIARVPDETDVGGELGPRASRDRSVSKHIRPPKNSGTLRRHWIRDGGRCIAQRARDCGETRRAGSPPHVRRPDAHTRKEHGEHDKGCEQPQRELLPWCGIDPYTGRAGSTYLNTSRR